MASPISTLRCPAAAHAPRVMPAASPTCLAPPNPAASLRRDGAHLSRLILIRRGRGSGSRNAGRSSKRAVLGRGVGGGVRQQVSVRAEVVEVEDPKQAKALVEEQGYTIVDVRDVVQHGKAYIKGSEHLPAYIINEDKDLGTLLAKQAHNNFTGFLYGQPFTKPNPSFLSQVQSKFPKDAKLLLVCQEGLRSSSVADSLEDVGYTNLAVLSNGLNKVPPGLFEKVGPKELKEAGVGGFSSIQRPVSIVLASFLIAGYLFLEFFPDQALELLGKQ